MLKGCFSIRYTCLTQKVIPLLKVWRDIVTDCVGF